MTIEVSEEERNLIMTALVMFEIRVSDQRPEIADEVILLVGKLRD